MSTPAFATRDEKLSTGYHDRLRQHPSTIYFDGLRGTLSMIVFVRHFLLPWKADLDTGFGEEAHFRSTTKRYMKLPFIRLVYSGPAVPVFFVMSGFVLSYRHLQLIRRGDTHGFVLRMMSAVLERPFRLYLPPLVGTLFVAFAVHFDLYASTYNDMNGAVPQRPEALGKLTHQLWDWWLFFEDLTSPWSWGPRNLDYNQHLWSLPRQFLASMVLFLTIIGLARLRVKIRATVLVAMWFYCLHTDRWDVSLFLAGMFLAERNLERASKLDVNKVGLQVSPAGFQRILSAQSGPNKTLWRCCFLVGLYFLSFPRVVATDSATGSLIKLSSIPGHYIFWHSVGAVMFIAAMEQDPWLQTLFRSHLLRLLGGLSFSLYITHGPVLHIIGFRVVPFVWRLTGKGTSLEYDLGIVVSLLFLTPIAFAVAYLFDVVVIRPCNGLVHRVEIVCCDRE